MQDKMTVDDATINLAASVVGRAYELISDGWVKGQMSGGEGSVEEFCIHGAMNLAIAEMFGDGYRGAGDIEAIATAFIVDEASTQYNFKGSWKRGGIAAAPFNDAPATKHEDVLNVLSAASKRLWDIGLDFESNGSSEGWIASKWADVDVNSEDAQQLLHASLV